MKILALQLPSEIIDKPRHCHLVLVYTTNFSNINGGYFSAISFSLIPQNGLLLLG